ncbi:hypothetical protein BH18THE1_BH18THE1_22700 [soil metagenome]
MPPVLNLKGYIYPDPLDKAPVFMQYMLMMLVTCVASVILVYAITDVFHLLEFKNFGVKVFEVAVFTLIAAPLMVLLRKSGSLFLILIILIPLFIFDIYLQANVRDYGNVALWTYLPGTFIDSVKVLPLRFLMTLTFDALIFGPLCLWITRLLALTIYKDRKVEASPSIEEYNNLFIPEWTSETIQKPDRDAGYWILRLLGFSYLAYLLILFTGILGAAPWPAQIADLILMTYKNPAMAINTISKIGIMILLTFIGAYNREVRYYCCWGLIVGHAVSTVSSLFFYFYDPPGTEYRDFLLTSAIVDGVMILLFIYIIIMSRQFAFKLNPDKGFTKYFSVPVQISKVVYLLIAFFSLLLLFTALYFRLFTDGNSSLGAVFGYPDPTLGNTLTLFSAVAYLSLLLAISEKLRQYLFGALLFPFFIGALIAIPLFIVKDIFGELTFQTRSGSFVLADWYFMLYISFNIAIFILLVSLRKMYYNVDYIISSLSPSSAKSVMARADAFVGGDAKKNSVVLMARD